MYGYASDNYKSSGFISKEDILKYVSEEEIFQLVFNKKPVEFEYITSPLRADKKPGCWFEKGLDGRLVFRDFGDPKSNRPIDCFKAVERFYGLSGFYETLLFIKNKLLKNRQLSIRENHVPEEPLIIKPVEILLETRDYHNRDAKVWSPYGISKQNLIDDGTFAVSKFSLKNSKKGDVTNRVYESCYAFTGFQEGRKKLYFPYRKGGTRFISNCKKNDVGNTKDTPRLGDTIIITKAYKDSRVLKNLSNNNIWIQNEGMLPDKDVILPLIGGYYNIIVWFDNDEAGRAASKKMVDYLSIDLGSKIKGICLPTVFLERGIKDPSDLYKKDSEQSLIDFIRTFK